jgi:hypothetical protein
MPIELGMASTHAPGVFAKTYDGWQRIWKRYGGDLPQPPEVALEDAACIASFVERSDAAFATLRKHLEDCAPDVLVVFAGDQMEWFDPSHLPNLMIYAGRDAIPAYTNVGADDHDPPLIPWEHPEQFAVELKVDYELSELLLTSLIAEGFDVAISRRIKPQGNPQRGAPHALVRPLAYLTPSFEIPIVPIIMKTVERTPATLSGERCLALGRAVARICKNLPKRIALYGSGGMSHDPMGPRSNWVDEPLDRWVLDQLTAGTPDRLCTLFSFQSAATISGTGELRTWLPVAGAMDELEPGRRAVAVDYFAARKTTAGLGWVVWP